MRMAPITCRLVHGYCVHGDEGGAGAQKAHLDAYVFGVIVLVYEEVVYLTDLLAVWGVDLVACEAVLDGGEPVAALFHASSPLHRGHFRHNHSKQSGSIRQLPFRSYVYTS